MNVPERVVLRMLNYLVRDPETGCLNWPLSVGSHGYGQIGWSDNGRTRMVLTHRVAYEAAHGSIPDGLTVDHVCRNRLCAEVTHLRLLTLVQNAGDNSVANRNRAKTQCPRGHAYDKENTRTDRHGRRYCRECQRIRDRRVAI